MGAGLKDYMRRRRVRKHLDRIERRLLRKKIFIPGKAAAVLSEEKKLHVRCIIEMMRTELDLGSTNTVLPRLFSLKVIERELVDHAYLDAEFVSRRSTDPWELKLATFFAYVLPSQRCEEWLGDLRESYQELQDGGYSRCYRSCVTVGRMVLLVWALVRIRFVDLFRGNN